MRGFLAIVSGTTRCSRCRACDVIDYPRVISASDRETADQTISRLRGVVERHELHYCFRAYRTHLDIKIASAAPL